VNIVSLSHAIFQPFGTGVTTMPPAGVNIAFEAGGDILLEDGTSQVQLESVSAPSSGDLLLESGAYVLLEDGASHIEFETGSGPASGDVLLEDGTYILLESGGRVELESGALVAFLNALIAPNLASLIVLTRADPGLMQIDPDLAYEIII